MSYTAEDFYDEVVLGAAKKESPLVAIASAGTGLEKFIYGLLWERAKFLDSTVEMVAAEILSYWGGDAFVIFSGGVGEGMAFGGRLPAGVCVSIKSDTGECGGNKLEKESGYD
jgi:hypothetical protein